MTLCTIKTSNLQDSRNPPKAFILCKKTPTQTFYLHWFHLKYFAGSPCLVAPPKPSSAVPDLNHDPNFHKGCAVPSPPSAQWAALCPHTLNPLIQRPIPVFSLLSAACDVLQEICPLRHCSDSLAQTL